MNALVTGGAGFIGHHLVRALVGRGDDVVVLDDFSSGSRDRLADLGSVRAVEGDVRDSGTLAEAVRGRDVVFHLAAIASVERSFQDPDRTNDVNVGGSIRLTLAASEAGVRRVVVASSSAVYGNGPSLPKRESMRPEPESPYAASKLAMEHNVHAIGANRGVETIALRYFNVYGPGQRPDSDYAAVIPLFIAAGLHGEPPILHGDGGQTRDFVYIDDVVAANLLAADATGASGLTANVGSGRRTSLTDLLAAIGGAVGSAPLEAVHGPARVGDVRDSVADIDLAKARIDYEPSVGLEAGIQRTVAWHRDSIAMPVAAR